MKKIAAALAEALVDGAVIIPNIIFMGLIYENRGNYLYLLPFVLSYSFAKAGMFVLQGFGSVKNPYKLVKGGVLLAGIGSGIAVFGSMYHIFWDIGAIFIGLGLSIYPSLFPTIQDELKGENKWEYKNSIIMGKICLMIFLTFIVLCRYKQAEIVFIGLFLFLITIFLFIKNINITEEMKKLELFEKNKYSWEYFLPALSILIFTFAVRILKQTANIFYITYIFLAFCLLILFGSIWKEKLFYLNSIEALLIGGLKNFLMVYSLLYFIAIDKPVNVGITYILIALGITFSIIINKKIKNILNQNYYNYLSIIGTLISLALLLIPHLYSIGIFLSSIFLSCDNSILLDKYLKDESLPIYERRLAKSRFYGMGAVLQQSIILILLIIVSWIKFKSADVAIRAYAYANGIGELEDVFYITRFIFITLTFFIGISLIRKIKKKKIERPSQN